MFDFCSTLQLCGLVIAESYCMFCLSEYEVVLPKTVNFLNKYVTT